MPGTGPRSSCRRTPLARFREVPGTPSMRVRCRDLADCPALSTASIHSCGAGPGASREGDTSATLKISDPDLCQSILAHGHPEVSDDLEVLSQQAYLLEPSRSGRGRTCGYAAKIRTNEGVPEGAVRKANGRQFGVRRSDAAIIDHASANDCAAGPCTGRRCGS